MTIREACLKDLGRDFARRGNTKRMSTNIRFNLPVRSSEPFRNNPKSIEPSINSVRATPHPIPGLGGFEDSPHMLRPRPHNWAPQPQTPKRTFQRSTDATCTSHNSQGAKGHLNPNFFKVLKPHRSVTSGSAQAQDVCAPQVLS